MEQLYEERYCAFVDILGFSELVARLSHGETPFWMLRDLLKIIHQPPKVENIKTFQGSDLRAQSISDAVCISTALNGPGLCHIFYALEQLAVSLLHQGFFVRGAIVKGGLYHSDGIVFGEALVRAFQLEQEVVRYPRIMITDAVVKDHDEYFGLDLFGLELMDSIEQADDGPRFLNILRIFPLVLRAHDKGKDRDEYLQKANQITYQIQRRYLESFDNPNHFEKVKWFARYWNRAMAAHFDVVARIKGPGVDLEPATWG
jgi:hypothetical protein